MINPIKECGHYTCAGCGETFKRARTDEEIEKEFKEYFPDHEPYAIVCDDCWKRTMNN